MVAFSIANPPHVLVIDDPAPGLPFVPSVRRYSLSAYLARVRGWKTWGKMMRAGEIIAFDHVRYDRGAPDMLTEGHDVIGRRYVAVHPSVPLGLIVTARGSGHLELDMRRLFDDPDNAAQATADAVHMLRQMDTAIEGKAESVSDSGQR